MGPKSLIRDHETLPVNGWHGHAARLPAAQYVKAYEAGWRHSASANASLDNEPGGNVGWAWEDGYLDYATDKRKWHRATCTEPEHDPCS